MILAFSEVVAVLGLSPCSDCEEGIYKGAGMDVKRHRPPVKPFPGS
jgi:hypothetical protein